MGWKSYVLKLALSSRVPFGSSLRRAKRRLFGYAPDPANLRDTLGSFEAMRGALESAGRPIAGATVLEIGSGWFPTIPILFSLLGARKVLLTDRTPHMDDVSFAATLDFLKPRLAEFPGAADRRRLEDFGCEYLAPFRADQVPDGSLDIVVSRTVLEHIPEPALREILVQLRPKLAPGGVMVHCIDNSDHLEHRDKSISRIQFLTWSDGMHRFVNWLMQEGENRLRHHEYRSLFEDCGYDVVAESGRPHPPTLAAAGRMRLCGRFGTMTPEQLSILSSLYVLTPGLRSGNAAAARERAAQGAR